MSEISVRPVTTKEDEQAFLRMPWIVYEDDPSWVAPPWQDHVNYFDPHHNAELVDFEFQKFVAWDGDTPVGTIIAHINKRHNEIYNERMGWFGQFELLNRPDVAEALLKTAEEWLKERGMTVMRGPATFSTNSEVGLLVQGYEHQPMFMTTHSPAYYQALVENYGLTKVMDLLSWSFNPQTQSLPDKIRRVARKTKDRRSYTVHKPKMADWDKETEKILEIYHQAWTENWGFIPFTQPMFETFAKEIKPMIDPDLIVLIEDGGRPIAFGAPVPNVYQAMHDAKLKPGEPHWWQMLKLIWQWKVLGKVKSLRVFLLGVVQDHRAAGLDTLMFVEMFDAAKKKGYELAEFSWILETNDMMNRAIELVGAELYKVHRVYEKPLSVNHESS